MISRILVLAVVAVFGGSFVAYALFFLVAAALGDLSAGIHTNAAAILLLQPILWVAFFVVLYRSNFLRRPSEPDKPIPKNR